MAKGHPVRVSPIDIHNAADYLDQKGLSGKISPAVLARSAKELDHSLADTLQLVGSMLDGGQGQGPAPIATKIAMVNPNG